MLLPGTIYSSPIQYSSFVDATDWGELIFTDDETNGDIKYTVQYFSGTWQDTAIVDQDTSPIDISSLDPVTHNEIRIKAILTDSGGTPYLEDWTVTTLVGCVDDSDCGFCEKCNLSNNTCEFQTTSEDTKDECSDLECTTGLCDGAGACGFEVSGTGMYG